MSASPDTRPTLATVFVCPACQGRLTIDGRVIACMGCDARYAVNGEGYADFSAAASGVVDSTTEEYSDLQTHSGPRVFQEYFVPYLRDRQAHRVLDFGCGVGLGVPLIVAQGFDAYGADLPSLARYWRRHGQPADRFVCTDPRVALPFPDGFFDTVIALGVVEHIGTTTGHITLSPAYQQERARFAAELLRVTRPGGSIVISCPNKSFPVDVQHGPYDAETPAGRLRMWIYERTLVNVHAVSGTNHLLSYGELEHLFAAGSSFRALPLTGYFGFLSFRDSPIRRALVAPAKAYFAHLPSRLRRSGLNPYLLAEIVK